MAELKKLIADPFDKQSCLQALSLIPAFPASVVDKVYEPLRIEIVDGAFSADDSKHFKCLLLMSGAAPGSLAEKDQQALTSLNLSECKDLTSLSGLKSLTTLNLGNCKEFTDLSPLSRLTSLTTLNLGDCSGLTDLSSLAGLTSLTTLVTTLDVRYCDRPPDLSALVGLTSLTSLIIKEYTSYNSKGLLADLGPFKDLTSLTTLVIAWKGVVDLSPLSGLTSLTSLDLSDCESIADLSAISCLTSLTKLNLKGCKSITDLSPLSGLKSLDTLNLENCESLTDLSPLSGLTSLITLNLENCVCITDLGPLSGLKSLNTLNLKKCKLFTDVSPLSGLTSLTSLNLLECESLTDLSPLSDLIPHIEIKADLGFSKEYVNDDLLDSLLAEQKSNFIKHDTSLKPTAKLLEALLDSTITNCYWADRLVASDDLIATIGKFPAEIIDKVYAKIEPAYRKKDGFDIWKCFLLQAGAVKGSIANLLSKSAIPNSDGSCTATDICGRQLKIWHMPNLVPSWFQDIDQFNASNDNVLDLDLIDAVSLVDSFSNLGTLVIPRRWINRPQSFDQIAESTIHHVTLRLEGLPLTERAIRELSKLKKLNKVTLDEPRSIKATIEALIQALPSLKYLEISSRLSSATEFDLSEIRCLDAVETLLIELPYVRINSLSAFGKLRSLKVLAPKLLLGDECTSNSLEELSLSDRGTWVDPDSERIWLSARGAASFDYVNAFPNLVTLSIDSSYFDRAELISGFKHLKTLKLEKMKRLNDFSHLLLNSSLESLAIVRSSDYFADRIGVLATLGNLKSLDVSENNHLTNLDFAAAFHDLEILTVNHCENLSTIDGLGILTQLKVFSANYCQKLSSINGVRGLPKLKKLYLFDAEGVKSLEPLADLISLEILDLGLRTSNYSHSQRSGHKILSNLVNLKTLNLAQNCELNDASIDFLNELRALQNLNLDGVNINSISAILNLPHLSNLNVSSFKGAKAELFLKPEVRIIPPKASTFV